MKSIPYVRVLLVILAVVGIAIWYKSHNSPGAGTGTGSSVFSPAGQQQNADAVTVTGLVGGEKLGYLADPQVISILKDKYGITVNATKEGSIDMVKGDSKGQDFLWPSSQVALELYKERGGKMVKNDTIFSSPIVFYSWAPVVDALIKQHLVTKIGPSYYIADFPKLMGVINRGTQWKDIGLPDLYGKITIRTTDPTASNSGMEFSGLLANVVNGDVVTEASLPKTVPVVKTFFAHLGYMQVSSGDLFDQFITQGEGQNPIIVGYENQLTEYTLAHPDYADTIRQQIRIVYPRPTVWSDHPMIALTPNGAKLLDALKNDPDLRRLAWDGHGFRTGLRNDPKTLQVVGIPETIQNVVPMPRPRIMESIIKSLSTN